MRLLALCALACAVPAAGFLGGGHSGRLARHAAARRVDRALAAADRPADNGDNDGASGEESGEESGLIKAEDMAYMQERIRKLREADATGTPRDAATQLFEMMTEVHPAETIRDFAVRLPSSIGGRCSS